MQVIASSQEVVKSFLAKKKKTINPTKYVTLQL